MSQLTCCPHCHTCFKVEQEQLDAYQGLVRCGNCLQAFNALIHRVQQDTTTSQSDMTELKEPVHQIDLSAVETSTSNHSSTKPTPPQSKTWLWASLLLLLMALVQSIYAWRAPLAQQSAGLNAALTASCQLIGCSIPLAQNASLVSIENSQLEADPKQKDVIVLHALLKNTADHSQALPKLALTLNDINDTLLARTILSSNDYLSDNSIKELAAGQELELALRMKTQDLRASGYRLELFY